MRLWPSGCLLYIITKSNKIYAIWIWKNSFTPNVHNCVNLRTFKTKQTEDKVDIYLDVYEWIDTVPIVFGCLRKGLTLSRATSQFDLLIATVESSLVYRKRPPRLFSRGASPTAPTLRSLHLSILVAWALRRRILKYDFIFTGIFIYL